MESSENQEQTGVKQRALRRHAFICLQVLKYRRLPFLVADAILVDLTNEGMKLKFARDIKVELGSTIWVKLPVSSDIDNDEFEVIPCTVRWYDESNFAVGVVIDQNNIDHTEALNRLVKEFVSLGRLAS